MRRQCDLVPEPPGAGVCHRIHAIMRPSVRSDGSPARSMTPFLPRPLSLPLVERVVLKNCEDGNVDLVHNFMASVF